MGVGGARRPGDGGVDQRGSRVRALAETGRRVRVGEGRRQRLPCRNGWIICGPDLADFHAILAEELNVESLMTEDDLDRFRRIVLEPNRKALGAKCRADLPAVLATLDTADADSLLLEIEAGIAALAGYQITMDDIEVRRTERAGHSAATPSDEDSGYVSLCPALPIPDTLRPLGR